MLKNRSTRFLGIFLFSLVLTISIVSAGASGFGRINITSNCPNNLCPFFDNPDGVWVFEWTDTGFTSDVVHASWDKEKLDSKQNFSINIEKTKNYCKYRIDRDADRVDISTFDIIDIQEEYTWKDKDWLINRINEVVISKCWHEGNYYPSYSVYSDGIIWDEIHTFCFKERNTLGRLGEIDLNRLVTETEWNIKANGKFTIPGTIISNSEAGSGVSDRLGDDALVQWQGFLSSGEYCPALNNELAAYDTSFDGNWRVIKDSNYDTYKNYVLNSIGADAKAVACYEGARSRCGGYSRTSAELGINQKASKAVASANIDDSVVVEDTSISNGALRINLNRQIAFPNFRVFVDSDYLELEISVGEPEVTCPSETIKFNEGDEAHNVDIISKNIGDGTGGFSLRVKECDAGFDEGDTTGFKLGAGDSITKSLIITGETDNGEKRSGECLVELKETTTQQNDTCVIKLEVDTPADCEIGREWCDFRGGFAVIKNCPNGFEDIKEECKSSEICDLDDLGVPFCRLITCVKDEDCPDGYECENEGCKRKEDECGKWTIIPSIDLIKWEGWKIPNFICIVNEWIQKIKLTLAIIMGFLGGLLAITYVSKFMKKKSLKKNWWILLLSFLIVGGALGFLAFTYFWVILISLLILGLIRIFLPI